RSDIIRPVEGTYSINNYGMLKNYIKVGIRNILKHKVFSFINIFGLAMAMAVSLFIILMLADQSAYDRFHPHADRVYRVLSSQNDGGPANASSPLPLASYATENYSQIINATTLLPKVGGDLIYLESEKVKSTEVRGFFADKNFFEVLGFELSAGNKFNALSEPNSIIITSDIAYRLFKDQNAIGKRVRFSDRGLGLMKIDLGSMKEGVPQDFGMYQVTGVIDNKAYKSHIKFDVLISSGSLPSLYQAGMLRDDSENWQAYSKGYTYLLAQENTSDESIEDLLSDLATTKYSTMEGLENLQLLSQPLAEISPGKFVGNPISLRLPIELYYILSAFALIIMLSACFNYTNLSIARITTRTKEIGIRKVNGASRMNLILQFLTESVIMSFLALIMANLLIWFAKPFAGELWISEILQFDITANLQVLLAFIGLTLLVGFMAGVYPALMVSRYNPVNILKDSGNTKKNKLSFRKIINIVQLGFSLLFIITSLLIHKQFKQFTQYDYGFEAAYILNIPLQGNSYRLLATEFESIPGVERVSASEFVPALLYRHGASIKRTIKGEGFNAENISVSPNFLENIGVKLTAGDNLLPSNTGKNTILLNEVAIASLGFADAATAIGQPVYINGNDEPSVIKGVFRNFNFETPFMGTGEMPLILYHLPNSFSYLNVKVASANYNSVIAMLEESWEEADPVHPIKIYNYEQQLADSNKWFGDLTIIIGLITVLALVISCLGLLGMAIYTTERRTKEMGIRKVLGATRKQLIMLMGKSYIRLLILAVVIFAPVSYLFNSLWLENIPNRVTFGIETLAIGILILLLLGVTTISSQLISASNKNPVDSLKRE
ncbi:MAG: FtsX-like permease family protein, partial [Cyclobacteriaceae bacterium]